MISRLVVFAGCLLVAVACTTDTEAGMPAPGDPSVQPELADPRDLAAVADDMCSVMQPEQLDSLSPGLTAAPDERPAPWGETACIWTNDEISFRLQPDTRTGATIEDTRRPTGTTDIEVLGAYPGSRDSGVNDRTCRMYVHTSSDERIALVYSRFSSQLPEHKMPCEFLTRIAEMAIENIPPKS